jgi:fatty-acyl-CoA synthase
MGAVLHTVNVRLSDDELEYVLRDAGGKIILVDASLLHRLASLAPRLDHVRAYIGFGLEASDLRTHLAGTPVHRYEDLIVGTSGFDWPEISERSPAGICYTSGTSGRPKGVVYSHRSTWLHALGLLSSGAIGVRERDRALVAVPMFHANAWGMPYAAVLCGATQLLPGNNLSGDDLVTFIQDEKATLLSAVPTIWSEILKVGRTRRIDLSSIRLGVSGGAAISRSILTEMKSEHGVRIIQGWGMTECSPLGGMAHPPAEIQPSDPSDIEWRLKSGRIIPGVEMRVVDETGATLGWDGASVGELQVRGPWITRAYHRDEAPEKFAEGWLRTGDIGSIDPRGYFKIADRAKDLIKSGGEWISSLDLEDALTDLPSIAEAAVIAIPDDKWTERPLACVVLAPGQTATTEDLRRHLLERFASWQVPDAWAYLEEIPKTGAGKPDKKVLRARQAAGDLDLSAPLD